MLKEKVKNTVIFLFILNALFLTGKIWFNEKLWSSDYNFFVFQNPFEMVSRWWRTPEEEYSMPKESLSRPRKIVVNSGDEMTVFYNSDPAFSALNDSLQAVIVPVLSGDTIIESSESNMEEWYTALYDGSIYAEYTVSYTPELFAQILGVKKSSAFSDLSAIEDYLIRKAPNDSAELFVRDAESGRVLKFLIAPKDTSIFSYFNQSPAEDELYFFAFDLGLSVASEDGEQPSQSVLISPMVLISANEISASRIYSSNPMLSSNGALENDTVNRILSRFHSSARTGRSYTDSEGTQVYVENSGTLKLYRDGMIEYQALSSDSGIPVDGEPGGLYTSLNQTIDFVETVWEGALPNQSINVCVSGDLSHAQIDSNTYRFTFDYYVAGNPVKTEIAAKDGREAMNDAVEVVISNGRITSYRHFIRQFRQEGTADLIPMIDALNYILSQNAADEPSNIITDIFLSYVEDGTGKELLPEWCVTFQDSDQVIRYGREAAP